MDDQPQKSPAITQLLHRWREGDTAAFDDVIEYVYKDLKRRANAYLRRERQDHTLQPTRLGHEGFIKIGDKRLRRDPAPDQFLCCTPPAPVIARRDRIGPGRADARAGGARPMSAPGRSQARIPEHAVRRVGQ